MVNLSRYWSGCLDIRSCPHNSLCVLDIRHYNIGQDVQMSGNWTRCLDISQGIQILAHVSQFCPGFSISVWVSRHWTRCPGITSCICILPQVSGHRHCCLDISSGILILVKVCRYWFSYPEIGLHCLNNSLGIWILV